MTVEERVKKIVAEIFEVEEQTITKETRFVEDLYAKSINIIEMIAWIEDEFDIEINLDQAKRNKTVGQAVAYIKTLL